MAESPVTTSSAAPTAGEHAAAMAGYQREGIARAEALGNRGPWRCNADGTPHRDILDAYHRHGFYVLQDVLRSDELLELRAEVGELLDRAPVARGAEVDARGRPALKFDFQRETYSFVRPLSDPVGGTDRAGGRHPSKMVEPRPDADAPEQVVYMMFGMCQTMPSALRVYGHPQLLAIAAAINGLDFTPYNDAIFVKQPGLGGSVAWHQDGLTHWQSPDWDEDIHGFNFQVQLYPATAGNCLWVVPGTHQRGRADIKALVAANGGSERLPDAVPLLCAAGDVTITNRQALHCSFANTSPDLRVSLTFGFHRKRSVLGARGVLGAESQEPYDEARIFARSRVIQVAIDARAQRFAGEPRYQYQPFAGLEDDYRWSRATYDAVIRDYNLLDLGI